MSTTDPEPEGMHLEVQEYLESKTVRRRLFPRAVLVGIAAGVLGGGFRILLELADAARAHLVERLPANPGVRFAFVASVAALGTLIAMLLGRVDPDAGGSGIPHMKAVLEGHSTMNWPRLLWVKFTGGLFAIGSGLALGREGPTVQMGGAAGMAVSQMTGASGREKRALMAAGAGSGLAAAFNAPLAGVTFVLEELQRDFQPVVFGAVLLSAAIATVISRLASGQFPVFQVPPIPAPSLAYLPVFAVLGCFGGLLGVVFNRGLLSSTKIVGEWRSKSIVWMAAGMGLLAACAWAVSPLLLGGGHGLSEAALHGEIALWPAALFLVVRLALVHSSYATGVPGGIFAPLLSLGALAGVITFHVTSHIVPTGGLGIAACSVAGMCAMFSGVVRAPLTGIILIGEMTGSYALLLPLLIAAFTAYLVAEGLNDTPIYEALLQRDSMKRGLNLVDEEPVTAEYEIMPGSPFESKRLRDIGLAQGVVVVLCRTKGKEFVPDANTVLQDHMRIVVAASSPTKLHEVEIGVRTSSP